MTAAELRRVDKLRGVERRRTVALVRKVLGERAVEADRQVNHDAARRLRDALRDLIAQLRALYDVGDEA